jgi:sugar lactone lactonase YvrE
MKNLLLFISVFLFMASCDEALPANQQQSNAALEPIFTDSMYQLTGVAASATGRLFTCYPYWSGPHKYSLVEILPGNKVRPYPDEAMNSWKDGDSGMKKWVCVQAVYIDDSNSMWVVDPASPKQKGVYNNSQKLVKINLSSNNVERVYALQGATDNHSYINDVRVDTKTQYAYLTNSSEGGIVIVDLKSGKARQLLQGDPSVIADKSYVFKIDDKEVEKGGAAFKANSDGIGLSPDGQYLWYKPLTDNKLYRIRTSFLKDTALTPGQLAGKVEKAGSVCATDGMEFDKKGDLFLGDLEHHKIIKITPDQKVVTLLKDDRLIWPDSYQIPGDGYLYVSCSQINKQPEFNGGINTRNTPYTIYRIKLP